MSERSLRWVNDVLKVHALLCSLSVIAAALATGVPAYGQATDPDLNDDGIVNILDISLVASCFGQDPTSVSRCAVADTEGDGDVDIADVQFVIAGYGQTFPVPDNTPPVVAIASPDNLALVTTPVINVSGSIDDAEAEVLVNGVAAIVTPGSFVAQGVPLQEGENLVTAVATDPSGNVASATISVSRDSTPPVVVISSPLDGSGVAASTVDIIGVVNDVRVGGTNLDDVTVIVNGIPALVGNGSFAASSVPLVAGPNVITAVATDSAGNSAQTGISVTASDAGGPTLTIVSGNAQSAVAAAMLGEPLVVQVEDDGGLPIVDRPVVFEVMRGDGSLDADGQAGRRIELLSDASGRTAVLFTLGQRAGPGANLVDVRADGIAGSAQFRATATPLAAAAVKIIAGDNQTGIAEQPLSLPFIVIVQDLLGNPVGGVEIRFDVLDGGGGFPDLAAQTVTSDADGRASAVLTLGPQLGNNNNVVAASFPAMVEDAAFFTASGRSAGAVEDTVVAGLVLDNTNRPIEGATALIPQSGQTAVTDAAGQFAITGAPVGSIALHIDGGTSNRPGTWPELEFEMTTISGIVNTIGMPIQLLPLDTTSARVVGGDQDVTLQMANVPGLALTVFANSVTCPDGSPECLAMVTQVPRDKVPMPPPGGTAPRLVWTIQPSGIHFDPPARISYPNVEGLGPGAIVDVLSFDHDLGEFVSVGPGSVSADGAVVSTDPGIGIRKGGWGYPEPQPDGRTCVNGCGQCKACANGACRPDADGTPGVQASATDCLMEVCQGGEPASVPDNGETPVQAAPDDCMAEVCEGGGVVTVVDDSETPQQSSHLPGRLPASGDCRAQVCQDGAVVKVIDDGETPPQIEADCELNICRQGDVATINDDTDTPPELSPNDCEKWECFNGGLTIVVDLTESPEAVPNPNDCVTKLCELSGIMVVDNNDEVPIQSSPNDCRQEVCQFGSPIPVPDDSETPIQSSSQDCITEFCSNGDMGALENNSEIPVQIAPDDCMREICSDSFSVSIPDLTEPGCSAP